MAGQQTLNLYVEVRLLCPQPERLTEMVSLFFLRWKSFELDASFFLNIMKDLVSLESLSVQIIMMKKIIVSCEQH